MPVPSTTDIVREIIAEAQRRDCGELAVIGTDATGVIIYWNETAQTLYGWESRETIGRNILDLMPTHQTQDEAALIMESLRRGEMWTGDFILRHRDGSPLLMNVTDVPVVMGGAVVGVVGVSRPERHNSPRSVPRVRS